MSRTSMSTLADDRDDMNVYYYPRNGTAWTDSPWITILEESDISDGPRMLRMDGGALIDPFEADFMLDLPIRIDWGVLGATTRSQQSSALHARP